MSGGNALHAMFSLYSVVLMSCANMDSSAALASPLHSCNGGGIVWPRAFFSSAFRTFAGNACVSQILIETLSFLLNVILSKYCSNWRKAPVFHGRGRTNFGRDWTEGMKRAESGTVSVVLGDELPYLRLWDWRSEPHVSGYKLKQY